MKDALLLIGFNRPELLTQVIDRVRLAAPPRIYLAVDGPREGRSSDVSLVERTRQLASTLDWGCSVETLFQEVNLGCGNGVSSAISWFFSHEERGIILEDDILPDPTFFPYCEELLDRYENDPRVFAVSGCNYVPLGHVSRPSDAYRFSRVPHIWGWATWRRTWSNYRLDISDWRIQLPPSRLFEASGRSALGAAYWWSTFELLGRKQVDTWDGQLVFQAMSEGGLSATPNVNLVENIGFGESATHTVRTPDQLQPAGAISLPTRSVPVSVDERADAWTRTHHFKATVPGFARQGARYLRSRLRRSA